MSILATFTDGNFETEVLGSSKPVLVDFWAQWCGPCRAMGPVLEDIQDEMGDAVVVGKLDIDANSNIASRLGISSIPAFILFKDGKEVERVIGAVPKNRLKAMFG